MHFLKCIKIRKPSSYKKKLRLNLSYYCAQVFIRLNLKSTFHNCNYNFQKPTWGFVKIVLAPCSIIYINKLRDFPPTYTTLITEIMNPQIAQFVFDNIKGKVPLFSTFTFFSPLQQICSDTHPDKF